MTHILFIHGLESGPSGNKPRALREAGYRVTAVQMPCNQRAIARDPATLAAVGACAAGLALAARRGVGTFALGVLGLGAISPIAAALATRRAFSRSVDVQFDALARAENVDVVMGSSFGGAVALELLRSGAWRGRTVLLCPAHERVATRARRPSPPRLDALPEEVARRVLVVHGLHDEVVPIANSRDLVRGSRARLIEVEDDHRLTKSATATGLQSWVEGTA